MTHEEKIKIIQMKKDGMTYSEISKATGINSNSIASFLRRNAKTSIPCPSRKCQYCEKKLSSKHQRKFCSNLCKNAWWNLHRKPKGSYSSCISHCLGCGKQINIYGNRNKKYCSHDCYIKHRFKKAGD